MGFLSRTPRAWRWIVGGIALLACVAVFGARLVDTPLRRRIESSMNASLKGYTVHIGAVRFHPLSGALDLVDWTVVQDANPTPPLAKVPRLKASVQWRSLLQGRLVADFRIEQPTLRLDPEQGAHEVNDPTPVAERGRSWQRAFEQIYPLKINEVAVVDGDMTYTPGEGLKPLQMTHVNLRAGNIRNIRSADRQYPSDLHLDAVVFDRGTLRVDGHADFLAEPHAGLQTDVALQDLPLPYLAGVLRDYVAIRKGTFSGWGALEYSPQIQRVDLQEVTISGADADYILTKANAAQSEHLRKRTLEAAKNVSNDPEIQLRATHVRMINGTIGMLDKTADPAYRVFLTDVDLTVQNFSNQQREGAGTVDIKGKFMGSGPSTVHAVFHPETKSPNFDLAVDINDTDMRAMNDLLRAKGNIDVTAGVFAFYSELKVRNNQVDGYVKPLFRDVVVYDPEQDKDKPLSQKIYQKIVGGVATLLENRNTEEVATKASVQGPIENPGTSTWEMVVRLVQNAFFKAILPGLERSQG
jgi:Domain of Unknown Function (DUF748)